MKKIFSFILVIFTIGVTACSIHFKVPETVVIDGTTYRSGFYGRLYPMNITYNDKAYMVDGNEFHRMDYEGHDWFHSSIGKLEAGTIYCNDAQWKREKEYYQNGNNFNYYCKVGAKTLDKEPILNCISNLDVQKFEMLMDFASENSYDPFKTNKKVNTRKLPIPNENESPTLVFYKESKDGFFTFGEEFDFRIVDGKLLLVYYYDYGHGEYEEMVAVDVPDEIASYFMELVLSEA